ncbi:MAG TPA: carbohydrate binding domain-containing protein, partial [Terriglobales bacterium]
MSQCAKPAILGSVTRQSLIPLLLLMVPLLGTPPASAQVVGQFEFENGVQGWVPFNGATITTSTAAAQGGMQSILATTNSSGGSSGPSLNASSLLLPGAKYNITGFVRLTTGEAPTSANFTILRNDPTCSGGVCFDTVGPFQVAVDDSGFAQIGGSYTVSTTETGLLLYAQLVGPMATQTFYLDSVVITQTAPPPGGTPVATYTFQDGGLDGWAPFGSPALSNAISPIPDPAGNTHSLLTASRTATFMGPSLNLLNVNGVVAGATYAVSAYVLLATPDSSNPTVTITTKRTDCGNTDGAFNNLVTSGALSSTTWTRVQGTFTFNDIPGPPTELTLFFQSSSATDSFYISDVVIGEVAPPPVPIDQQDNSGITSTFEDGEVDGWSSRSGTSSVTNVSGVAHSGSSSLLTTGRIGNFDGPQINVSNKMYVGSQYNISAWVMLQPVDGSSHIINMSLQTTFQGNTSFPGV